MSRKFYITDVFCEGNYSGNQLATVVDCENLDTEEMQQIARAFNFAETTFYLGGDEANGFDVRIFTPATELPFAGHPTLGTSFLIRHHIEQFQSTSLTLNLKVGKIPVSFESDGVIWMTQNSPTFSKGPDRQTLANMLSLNIEDIDDKYPAMMVSTGLAFLIVPLSSMDALKRAQHRDLSATEGVLAFCHDAYQPDHEFAARMFAPGLGVGEDAATGSANGCLAAYLVENAYLGERQVNAIVGQGFEIGRPSALHLRANDEKIQVGGRVNLVATGEWQL